MCETIHYARYIILMDSSFGVRFYDKGERGDAIIELARLRENNEHKYSLVEVLVYDDETH